MIVFAPEWLSRRAHKNLLLLQTQSIKHSHTHRVVLLPTETKDSRPMWRNEDISSVCGVCVCVCVCVCDPGRCEDRFPLPQSTSCVNSSRDELRCTHTGDRSQLGSGRCSWASSLCAPDVHRGCSPDTTQTVPSPHGGTLHIHWHTGGT